MPPGIGYGAKAVSSLGRRMATGAAVGGTFGAALESLPGEGSFFGGMARGAMYGAGAGLASRSFISGSSAAKGAATAAMGGAAIGGVYGMFSGDTTMYGGMVKGGMLGAGLFSGARYAGAALGSNSVRGGIRRAGMRMIGDIGRAGGPTIRSNKSFQSVSSSLRNWR